MPDPIGKTLHASADLLAPSQARTATWILNDQDNDREGRGIHLIINVSAIAGGSVTPKLQGIANGDYYDLLTGLPITTTGITVLKMFPGATPINNAVANDVLPPQWRALMTHADASSTTYTVVANYLA